MPETPRSVHQAMGLGLRMGFGKRPAFLIVDMQNEFVAPAGTLNAYERARIAMPHIIRLRGVCRELDVPILYTRGIVHRSRVDEGLWQMKSARHREGVAQIDGTWGAEICDELRPEPDEIVIDKHKPSAFSGSDLEVYLRGLAVDTLVIVGTSTSGCVRATVTDAFMREIRVILPLEGQIERHQDILDANLFDMDSKYADVLSTEAVIVELRRIKSETLPA
jgi:maleamate amidohydrolase